MDNDSHDRTRVLFYFIPGNPGYAEYYTDFFNALKRQLSWAHGHIHVHGQDLAGFRDDTHPPFTQESPPFDLEGQIQTVWKRVAEASASGGLPYDYVVLGGHSVGAYIALEVFHRNLRNPSVAPHLNLYAGILLFPTVTHIAQSANGKRLSMLAAIPPLRSTIHLLIKAFLFFWPAWVLQNVVSKLMGFSTKATQVTTDFLKSRDGVWQALYMGMDEMQTIGEERWEKDLWDMSMGSEENERDRSPRFFFLFGQNDRWVSDHFRANFIRAREKHIDNGWARVEIDESGLPHAFCATEKNSEVVAEKAASWLHEIWEAASSRHKPR